MANRFTISTVFKALDQMSGPMSRMQKNSKSLFGTLLKANVVGNLVTGGIRRVAGGIKNLAVEGLNLASDLVEVQNVVDTSFGPAGAKKVNAWARQATTAFGLTELQAKQFSGTMGAMLKSSGLAGDQIVEMSTKLSGLAGDFASFYNLPIEEAFDKIRAGISGETEPLKRIGINMSVANMQAFALAQGIRKKWAAMSQGEQAMLRYQYLLNASTDAQGDFAKTLETSYANQKRVLRTNINQITARALSAVLPLALKVAKQLNSIVGRIGEWVAANQELIAQKVQNVFNKIAGALSWIRDHGPLVKNVFWAIVGALVGIKVATIAASIATTAFGAALGATPIGAIILGIMGLIFAVRFLIKHWEGVVDVFRRVRDWIFKALDNPLVRGIAIVLAPFITLPLLIIKHWEHVKEAVSGIVDWILSAVEKVTGTVGRIGEFFGGVFGGRERGQGIGAAAPNAGLIESRAYSEQRSTLDVNFNNTPAGTTMRQQGAAPGITVNGGFALAGARF